MAVPNIFSAGTLARSADVNENFSYVGMVPVGTILPWAKTQGNKRTASTTSLSTNKLVDSGASFNSTFLNKIITMTGFSESNSQSTASTSYVVLKTITLDSSQNDGAYVTGLSYSVSGSINQLYYRAKLYFVGGTTEYTNEITPNGAGTYALTITTQNKKVWKIEEEAKKISGGADALISASTGTFGAGYYSYITEIDSSTQVSINYGLFNNTITSGSYGYKIFLTEKLDSLFVECNGQELDDEDSVFYGETIPNLNGENRFLRGSSTSGSTGGANTINLAHTHGGTQGSAGAGYDWTGSETTVNMTSALSSTQSILPSYYEVVYIMRVK